MSSILYEKQGQLALLTLNRPDKYNSFNSEMSQLLQHYLKQCADDENVRCIMLTGAGKGFCAGQDLAEFPDPKTIDFDRVVSQNYNPLVQLVRQMPKPVVAAVNGIAAGAGANLALMCDIVLASESASFVQAFSKISLIPDSGGTWILPRLIGLQRAAALMFSADKISAKEALQMGMIYQFYPDDQFQDQSMQFAMRLTNMPTKAIAHTKHLLNLSFENSLNEQLQAELEAQVKSGKTDDFVEGVQAFLEKRPPGFKGK